MYSGFSSQPMNRLPFCSATNAVVPLPMSTFAPRAGNLLMDTWIPVGAARRRAESELDRLMQGAWVRRFDAVVVGKLAPMGRSVAHSIRVIQELVALGIRFIATTQNIDADESNPMSRFLLHIFAAFAELEREMIREPVVSGIKTARIKGQSIGRPKRIFRRDEVNKMRA